MTRRPRPKLDYPHPTIFPAWVHRWEDPTEVVLWSGWQVSKHFAARRYPNGWRLTHLPSGCGMAGFWTNTLSQAVRIAASLEAIGGWGTMRPKPRTMRKAGRLAKMRALVWVV